MEGTQTEHIYKGCNFMKTKCIEMVIKMIQLIIYIYIMINNINPLK